MATHVLNGGERDRADTQAVRRIGNVEVDAATRTLTGPAGEARLEPRVLTVLMTLGEADGRVLSRDEMMRLCWGGQIVGDDAINRTISAARKAARSIGADFQIETISKSGYRLVNTSGVKGGFAFGRRALVASALAVAAGGALGWALTRPRRTPEVAQLVERGRQALRDDLPNAAEKGTGFFEAAVQRAPEDAEAWALLSVALAKAVEYAPRPDIADLVRQCETAAKRALALDPDQSDARAALAILQPTFGDWTASDARFRNVLSDAPDNQHALAALAMLMQGVGRSRLAVEYSLRTTRIEPLSPVYHYRLAYQQWSSGQFDRAIQRLDRALQLWPRHPGVWYAKLLVSGLGGQPSAGLAMLQELAEREPVMPPAAMKDWQLTLTALASGSAQDKRAARNEVWERATHGSNGAANAILLLSALGEADDALTVAEGYLLRRGPMLGVLGYASDQPVVNDQRWRKTMMLFVPATASLRETPGFARLCDGIGLSEYWQRADIVPDFRHRQ